GGLVPELRRLRLHVAGRAGRPASPDARRRLPECRPAGGREHGRPGLRGGLESGSGGSPPITRGALQPGLIPAEKKGMRRLLLLPAVFVALTMTAITYAAGRRLAVTPARTSTQAPTIATVVVPDVRNESFVFAKGQLQDGGFAWKVVGRVQGFPAN